MKNFPILLSILISITFVAFAVYLIRLEKEQDVQGLSESFVVMEDNVQIILVTATNRGYFPTSVNAKANIPTILRMKSENSYGCERSFRIPKIKVTEIIPQEGITDIDLGIPKKGEDILGSCSMGMYTFTIKFN